MLKTPEQIKEEVRKTLKEKEQSWGINTARTTEQVEEEIKKFLNEISQEWKDHLDRKKEDYFLTLHETKDPKKKEEIAKEVRKVLDWIEETIKEENKKNNLEGWKELYGNWNGDPDTSETKYNGEKDFCGYLSDLRIHLENWKRVSYEQSQQELIEKLRDILQVVGINPDDENIQKEVEELKKIQTDLDDLEIDKSEVKETIENERKGLKELAAKLNLTVENKTPEETKEEISQEIEKISQINKWLRINHIGEKTWEKIKIKAQIEIKER